MMITYVYRRRRTGLIEITTISREEILKEEKEKNKKKMEEDIILSFELLYRLDDTNPKQVIKDLRPYRYLLCTEETLFKDHPGLREYFDERKYENPRNEVSLIEIDPGVVQKRLLEINEILNRLVRNNVISINKNQVSKNKAIFDQEIGNIVYRCDVYNYISDIYGNLTGELVKEYESLSMTKKKILETLDTIPTVSKKADYLNEEIRTNFGEDFDDLLEFLPEWYKIRYKMIKFESSVKQRETGNIAVECTNKNRLKRRGELDNNEKQELLKERIYKEFELGKTYTGEKIISLLQEIYKDLEIEKIARIKDLENFFNMTKVNLRTSEYKLNIRILV